MDLLGFILLLLVVFGFWMLLAPDPQPDTRPTTEQLLERQRQIDRANNQEIM